MSPVVLEMPSTTPSPPGAFLARLVRVDEWSTAVGGEVFVARAGRVVRVGILELVCGGGSVAWIAQSGPEPRQLISKDEGDELWIAPLQLQEGGVKG